MMKSTIYALLDCNNFYASCERVFNPDLQNKSIVILSNNDGCIIARSNEAKAIGIPMGAPYFKYKKLIEESHTTVFSSNYALYGDMSARVMSLLSQFTPLYEIYSIDEAFLRLDGLNIQDFIKYASAMKQHILRCTGMPVSIGIGPTKTLAKIANYIAKKKIIQGVFEVTDKNVDEILANLAVDNIWGVGWKLSARLRKQGIHSALDLKQISPVTMRKQFSVVVEKMVHELNGYSCLALEETQPKRNITSSRSFGKKVTALSDLKEAIASHCTKACAKLRTQNSFANGILLFIKTSKHDEKQSYCNFSTVIQFDTPLNDTGLIIRQVLPAVERLFRPHLKYNKVGVTLLDLVREDLLQQDCFTPSPNRHALMETLDAINAKYKKDTLFYAAEGIKKGWKMQQNSKSPHFTTSWDELALAHAI